MSLGSCRRDLGEPLCRPEFLSGDVPTFEVEELRHPCIMQRCDHKENRSAFGMSADS